jgi:hypothetical protein
LRHDGSNLTLALITEEVSGLREDWMKHADQVLEDESLVTAGLAG